MSKEFDENEFANSSSQRNVFVCDHPYMITEYGYSIDEVKKRLLKDCKDKIAFLNDGMQKLWDDVKEVFEQRFLIIENKPFWFDRKLIALYLKCPKNYEYFYGNENIEKIKNFEINVDNFNFRIPKISEVKSTFSCPDNPYIKKIGKDFVLTWFEPADIFEYSSTESLEYSLENTTCTYKEHSVQLNLVLSSSDDADFCKVYSVIDKKSGVFRGFSKDDVLGFSFYRECSSYALTIPICRLLPKENREYTSVEVFFIFMKNKFIPSYLKSNTKKRYIQFMNIYNDIQKFITVLPEKGRFTLNEEVFYKDVASENYKGILDFEIETQLQDKRKIEDLGMAIGKDELLKCDFIRANMSIYPDSRLKDNNQGHWELCETLPKNYVKMPLSATTNWIARPPKLDIKNGICAIDFGTKSTIVVCRNGSSEYLLRIGKADWSEEPKKMDYENPTAIEFINIKQFKSAYENRAGRPFTRWLDVTVSHQAESAIFKNNIEVSNYYCVFNELKQWTNYSKQHILLSDETGEQWELPPYEAVKAGEFDPIEIYAYYLGLYINNMVNGIYLRYIMSFPVNYSRAVRTKIVTSFERGLKKSLPPAILQDSEVMGEFEVQQGCSEPAAYAITALHEFGLEPQNPEDSVAYAVFDFGGGTTDFDFGIETISDKRWHFDLMQFGAGGDPYLGGENILELMAYQVFKDNLAEMRKHEIHIIMPQKGKRFSGSEVLVEERKSASQEAYINMRILQKRLRNLWEQKSEENDDYKTPYENGDLVISLYDNYGEKKDVPFKIDADELEELIKNQIKVGVDNFFTSMWAAFNNRDIKAPIHIFLAGNASKSSFVQEIFEQTIDQLEEEGIDNNGELTLSKEDIKLHFPLGMDKDKRQDGSVKDEIELEQQRTGKTGVAFGLLRCRAGSRDIRIINKNDDVSSLIKEVQFPYYLGKIDRNGYFKITVGRSVSYGVWVAYTDACESRFELRYTKEARALEGRMKDEEVQTILCRITEDEVSEAEDVQIFIRKIGPNEIEYIVGTEKDMEDGNIQGKIYQVKLK